MPASFFSPGGAMGIRFQCPKGHPLNVKAELAGKRALCPECGAKLVVPLADASPTAVVAAAQRAGAGAHSAPSSIMLSGSASDSTSAEPARNGTSQSPPQPIATATGPPRLGTWYLRPTSGGQFGPATDDVLRAWIAEGRVAADAHVWREGWEQWKLARDAADALPAPLAAMPVTAAPPDAAPRPSDTATPAQPSPAPTIAEATAMPVSRYVAHRNRSKRTQFTLAMLMLLALVVLAGLLIWVIWRNVEPTAATDTRVANPLAQSAERPYVAWV